MVDHPMDSASVKGSDTSQRIIKARMCTCKRDQFSVKRDLPGSKETEPEDHPGTHVHLCLFAWMYHVCECV